MTPETAKELRERLLIELRDSHPRLDITPLSARELPPSIDPAWREIAQTSGTRAALRAERMWRKALPDAFARVRRLIVETCIDVFPVHVSERSFTAPELVLVYVVDRDGSRNFILGGVPVSPERAQQRIGVWGRGHWPHSTARWSELPGTIGDFYTRLHDGLMTTWGQTQGYGIESLASVMRFSDLDQPETMGDDVVVGRLSPEDGTEIEEFDENHWPDCVRLVTCFSNLQYGGTMIDLDHPDDVWDYSWESGLWVVSRALLDELEEQIARRLFWDSPPPTPIPDEPHAPTDVQLHITAALACVYGRLAAGRAVPATSPSFDRDAFRSWASTLPAHLHPAIAPSDMISYQAIATAIAVLQDSALDYSTEQWKRNAAILGLGDLVGAEIESVVICFGVFRAVVSAIRLTSAAGYVAPPANHSLATRDLPGLVVRHPLVRGIAVGQDISAEQGFTVQRLVTYSGAGNTRLATGAYGFVAWLDGRHVVTLFATSLPSNQEGDGDRQILADIHAAAVAAMGSHSV